MFFHSSPDELEPGLVLKPMNRMRMHDEIERVLERMRPAHMIPRAEAVFMTHGLEDMQK